MTRIHSTWITLLLLSGTACTYKFPDVKDESQVYRCVADADCAGGFVCIDQVCLDRQKIGGNVTVLNGRVKGPAAVAYTMWNGVELTAPVATDGSFTLAVPKASELVIVYSRGPATGGYERVQLAAILGTNDGAPLYPPLLTPFTTAFHGAVVAANGGAVPRTRAELVAAEQRITEKVTEDQLLDAAGALHLVGNGAATLPPDVASTLALAADPAAMRNFVAKIRAAGPVGTDPIAADLTALLNQSEVTGSFADGSPLPPGYFSALQRRHGFVGYADEHLTLGASGTYHDSLTTGAAVPAVSALSWATTPDGRLVGTLGTPLSLSLTLTASQAASYYPEPTRTQILAAVGSSSLYVTFTMTDLTARRLVGGQGADWVLVAKHGTLGLSQELANYGVTAGDVTGDAPSASRVWLRSDEHSPYVAWPAPLAGSTWAMQVILPSDLAYLGETVSSRPTPTGVFLAFGPSGLGTLFGGVLKASGPMSISWSQGTDSTVTITFPGGLHTQRLALWDVESPAYGVMGWHHLDAGADYLGYGPAYLVQVADFAPADLVTADGEYWQTDINAGYYPPEAEGTPADFRAGYELKADSTAVRRLVTGDPVSGYQPLLRPVFWHADGHDVIIELRRDSQTAYSTCALGGTDPSCYVMRQRRWEPVARSADGDHLYMIEREGNIDTTGMTWNGQTWLRNGTPADLTKFEYGIPPRVVTYSRLPIPAP